LACKDDNGPSDSAKAGDLSVGGVTAKLSPLKATQSV
jgi:hypothetical protein